MKIKDTFKDIKNTLKMEMGRINIESMNPESFEFKTQSLRFESKTSIKKVQYKFNPKIISPRATKVTVKDISLPKSDLTLREIEMPDKATKISAVELPEKKVEIKSERFLYSYACHEFSKIEIPNRIETDEVFVECRINRQTPIKNRVNLFGIKVVKKNVKIHRFKNPRSIPMIKKPVKKSSVNFIYVFKGKEYLEKLGYAYSDLLFINYFDSIPMDLIVKITIEKDELRLYYKRGIPKNIIDIALFESKKDGKLLIAPVKRGHNYR